MGIGNIKVDLKELEEKKRKNTEDRLKFIDWWSDYVKKHPEKAFRQQKKLIDSQFEKKKLNKP